MAVSQPETRSVVVSGRKNVLAIRREDDIIYDT
jgi:hypothetical protein